MFLQLGEICVDVMNICDFGACGAAELNATRPARLQLSFILGVLRKRRVSQLYREILFISN